MKEPLTPAQRRRNWLIFAMLIGFILLIYLISIIQMSRAT